VEVVSRKVYEGDEMTKKETIEKNIGMTFDFVRYLVDHPEMIDNIPNGAVIEFVDKEIALKKVPAKIRKEKTVSFQVEHTFAPVKPISHTIHIS